MTAFLFRRELVLEMHTSRASFDHRLHQLVGVEGAAEPGLGVGNDPGHPVRVVAIAFRVGDLVGTAQCVIDAPDHIGHRIHRVERLVRIHLPGSVGVGSNLPAR